MSKLPTVFSICLVCGWATTGLADQHDKVEALQHYDRGLSLAKQRAYGEAIAEFNRAYEIGHDFVVLYDIGQAYLAMEQPVYAVDALKRYLTEGGKHLPKARRTAIEAEIAKQEKRIATVVIQSAQPGAVIRVDGLVIGTTPLSQGIRVNAGVHAYSASATGYLPWEQRLELAGRERRTIDVRLQADTPAQALPSTTPVAAVPVPAPPPPPQALLPAPAPASPTPTIVPEPVAPPKPASPANPPSDGNTAVAQDSRPEQKPTSSGRTAGYLVGAVGVAALVTGGVFGALAISKRHESDNACPNNQCSAAGVSLNDDAKTYARVCDLTIGAGLVAVAVATYLLLRSPKEETTPQTKTAQGPYLTAAVGRGEAGLLLGGAW